MDDPKERKIKIVEIVTKVPLRLEQITKTVKIENPTNLSFLTQNLKIEDEERFTQSCQVMKQLPL